MKIGKDAFEYYVSLGDARSYQAVAEKYGASKRSVTKRAKSEGWASKLAQMEAEAKAKAAAKMKEGMEEVHSRHVKMLRAMAARAAKGLQDYPLTSGMDAIKAAEMVIKLERILIGQPSEVTAQLVEKASREEVQALVTTKPVGTDGEDDY